MNYYDIRGSFSPKWATSSAYSDCMRFDHSQPDVVCPLCGSRHNAHPKWLGPYKCYLEGKNRADVLWGGFPHLILSRRFLDLFEKEGLTGIKDVIELHMYYRKQELEEKYYYPLFEYSQKALEYAKEKNVTAIYREGCALCERDDYFNLEKYHLYFNDVHEFDMFKTYDRPGRIYCNDIFVDFCRRNKIQNIVETLAAGDTYLYDFDPSDKEIRARFNPVFPS